MTSPLMKKSILNILVILGGSLIFFTAPDCPADTREEEVIATLNGKPIYLSDVEQNLAFRLYRLRGNIYLLLKKETEEIVNLTGSNFRRLFKLKEVMVQ